MKITIDLKEEPIDFTKNQILVRKKDGIKVNVITNLPTHNDLFCGLNLSNGEFLDNLIKSEFRIEKPIFKKVNWNNLEQWLYYKENNKFVIVQLISKSRKDTDKDIFFCEIILDQINNFTGVQCFEKKEFKSFKGSITVD